MPDNSNQSTNAAQHDQDLQSVNAAGEATKQQVQQNPEFSQKLGATPAMQNMVIDIEKELLAEITRNLDQEKMSPEQAEELAKEFLALLPIKDQEDLLEKLSKFSQQNTEAQGIYLKFAKPLEEEERQKKLTLMSQHIKNGEIEHALAVAKGGLPNA